MIEDERLIDYILPNAGPMTRDAAAEPFLLFGKAVRLTTLLVIWTWIAWAICAGLYFVGCVVWRLL